MLVLDLAQKLFYFQRDHYVKGGERFVQQNNGRPRDEKAQHLHLVFHTVGVPLDEPVPVLRSNLHHVEIIIGGASVPNTCSIDVHIKTHEFISSEKVRQNGCREHITHVVRSQGAACAVVQHKLCCAAVGRHLVRQAVEQCGFACAVAPQQAVDLALLEREAAASKNFLFSKVFSDACQFQFHLCLFSFRSSRPRKREKAPPAPCPEKGAAMPCLREKRSGRRSGAAAVLHGFLQ